MRDHGGQSTALFREKAPLAPKPWLDCSTSLNPCGHPPSLQGLTQHLPSLVTHYPDADADELRQHLAQVHGQSKEALFCGNGSTDCMVQSVRASGAICGVATAPHWSGYAEISAAARIPFRIGDIHTLQIGEIFFVATPNNPDGKCISPVEFQSIALAHSHSFFLIDLAFDDYLHAPQESPWWKGEWPQNAIRVKSLTKFFSMAGIRLGFVVMPQSLEDAPVAVTLANQCPCHLVWTALV